MVIENYTKDLKASSSCRFYNDWKIINDDEPPSLGKFDVEDSVKLVAIVAIFDFTKDYLIKQQIIPDNI